MIDSPNLKTGSRFKLFELGADRHLHPIIGEEPSPDWLRDEAVRWVACRDSGAEAVETLCQSCGIELPPQVSNNLRHPLPRPTVVGLERVLFISYASGVSETVRRGLAVCAPSTLLTFHESSELIDAVFKDCQHERMIRARSPLAILFELIEAALQGLAGRMFRLRGKLVTLSDQLESGTRELESEEHLGLKQETTALEIQLEDHLYCLSELAKFDSESVDAKLVRPLMLQLQADLDHGIGAVARLNSRITDLHQFQVRQADETTNYRLKVLTILSAIYLPATLIAGIYGMNFTNIPITTIRHGYALVIVIMAAVVFGQLLFFYKRGWFK